MLPETSKTKGRVIWKNCSNMPLFKGGEPKAEDCRQDSSGDCWLQATLISILKQKGTKPIKDMFIDHGKTVLVRLYYPKKEILPNGEKNLNWVPKYYRVKKQVPIYNEKTDEKNNGQYPYNKSRAGWVHYLQAAVAKSNISNKAKMHEKDFDRHRPNLFNHTQIVDGKKIRDYNSIHGGTSQIAMNMIFGNDANRDFIDATRDYKDTEQTAKMGHPIYCFNMTHNSKNKTISPDECYQLIKDRLDSGKVVTICFSRINYDLFVFSNHEYAVVGCSEDFAGRKYLRLINPHSERWGRGYIHTSLKGIGDEGFDLDFSKAYNYIYTISLF